MGCPDAPKDTASSHLLCSEVLTEAYENIEWWGTDGEAAVIHGPDRGSPAVPADVLDGLHDLIDALDRSEGRGRLAPRGEE